MTVQTSNELQTFDQRAVIKVCGIGGGGGNAIGRMIQAKLEDVEFITINTDAQALKNSPAGNRLQIGAQLTNGLGSGAKPEIGFQAAEEDRERIREVLSGADMVFLTAGLGGGTGTGASPIVAEEARNTGALTVAIVTLPFSFEGKERMANALKGLAELEKHVDTLIVVPNDRVSALSHESMSFLSAFSMADEVLSNGVRAISELITIPGLINLDFADVRTIMQARGRALMGIGTAEGDERSVRAAEEAIVCPLLEQSNINGAMGVIVNIKGGCDIRMREVQNAVNAVKKAAHPDANIIFGAVIDENERQEVQVTVIAAGFPKGVSEAFLTQEPAPAREETKSPAPQPAPKPTSAPAGALKEPPAASKPSATPREQLLFPDEKTKQSELEPEVPQEPERDMGIPTFLWKRMQQRKK
ncbi:MAG TPA: cell division protein FtsZ [Candidatus Hydrogenedentes bacterium]|nr:cell division protein FtsZ [Candidatus Hydrogenedentota bacterium]